MKTQRYWFKNSQGDNVEVEDYIDENGSVIGGVLLQGRSKREGYYRTSKYHAERSISPASHYHKTAIAKDINNVKKRRS